jgi:cyclo(L-tyrosyl-L-tyrosyl) synthase
MIQSQKIDEQSFEYNPKIHPNTHALIGVSPFNGYFTTSNIETLLRWAHFNFKDFSIFTMDKASKYNLMAVGYEELEAVKKTRKQDQHLKNKIIRGLEKIGFSPEEAEKKILLISNLYENDKYNEIYKYCLHLFKTNPSFKSDCLSASKYTLVDKAEKVTEEAAHLAVNYLLEELPVWINTPYILDIPFSVFVYKDLSLPWYNIFHRYGLVSPNQKIFIRCISS